MKLKKCTSWFLIVLMLISNIGLSINVHYCGGTIASVSVSQLHSETKVKKCCAFEKEDGSCCKDKQIKVDKKSDNATLKAFIFQFALPSFNSYNNLFAFEEIVETVSQKILHYYVDANAPPLYKLYCQLVYYA